eukprot:scaffold1456_cov392-Prasinococcus_capsulatus_cf.AAC.9
MPFDLITGRFIPEKTNIWRDCVDGYLDWVKVCCSARSNRGIGRVWRCSVPLSLRSAAATAAGTDRPAVACRRSTSPRARP